MKHIFFVSLLVASVLVACNTKHTYSVGKSLTPQQQEEYKWKIIRYSARAPEGISFEERFYPAYDTFYIEQARLHKFDAYVIKENTHYFILSRPAPSLVEKRVAIGGKFQLNNRNEVINYEEVFRTWKMVPDTLAKREMILFDLFVNNKPLSPYETKNSNGVEFIEFPDEQTYYDKNEKQWRVRSL